MATTWHTLTSEDFLDHPYNNTITNERAIEIPLALRWLKKENNITEIGAVTPYYSPVTHEVIDPHDEKATISDYMENVDLTGKNVLSISTIEHIGTTDYLDGQIMFPDVEFIDKNAAIECLKQILNQSKKCFVTIPIGYNKFLDAWLHEHLHLLDCFGYHKKYLYSYETRHQPVQLLWTYHEKVEDLNYHYCYPYPFGNFILCIEGWQKK